LAPATLRGSGVAIGEADGTIRAAALTKSWPRLGHEGQIAAAKSSWEQMRMILVRL
jgi:hypothetical protein